MRLSPFNVPRFSTKFTKYSRIQDIQCNNEVYFRFYLESSRISNYDWYVSKWALNRITNTQLRRSRKFFNIPNQISSNNSLIWSSILHHWECFPPRSNARNFFLILPPTTVSNFKTWKKWNVENKFYVFSPNHLHVFIYAIFTSIRQQQRWFLSHYALQWVVWEIFFRLSY